MLDFNKIRTYSIKERKHKASSQEFSIKDPDPEFLKNPDLIKLSQHIIASYKNKKQVIAMLGGHVIKQGLAPYLISLMKKHVITHIAMNGSVSIHDFEIALIGETSEDVQSSIEDGSFGMVEETGSLMNEAINDGAGKNLGYGEAISELIGTLPNKEQSILYQSYRLGIPTTVHVAIGTDTIHQHPSCNGASLGKTSYQDFKIFTDSVSKLENGVILNIGSAVIMPEVFLKALSIARNLSFPLKKITTANLDMLEHYRPKVNVVQRPTSLGGQGYDIRGRHEKTIPALYHLIINGIK